MVTIPCWPVVLRANFNFLPQHVTRIIHALTRREARWRVGELVGWLASSSWLVGQLRACSRACLLARLVGWWLVAWLVGCLALTGIAHALCLSNTNTRTHNHSHFGGAVRELGDEEAMQGATKGRRRRSEAQQKDGSTLAHLFLCLFCVTGLWLWDSPRAQSSNNFQ